MFTYVRLKNFLSFSDVVFDFRKNKNSVKRFIAIYGENGSGKSNFVRSIELICHTMTSFGMVKQAEDIMEYLKNREEDAPADFIEQLMRDTNLLQYLSACRTIECDDLTEVEYGFLLDGYEGVYKLSFAERITHESLYYFTGKQRGYLFDISVDEDERINSKLSGNLFKDNKAKAEITDEVRKYWGKHTLLGILIQIIEEQNESYVKESLSEYLLKVIDMLWDLTVVSKATNQQNTSIINKKPENVLQDLRRGKIPQKRLPVLQKTERILRDFFTQAYADIKDVVYDVQYVENDSIKYQLYVDKMIAGRVRRINFKNESAGTQQVLEIVRMLLGLFCGVTVVYDEIDNGIHDILLDQVINSITDEIDGQLIITTHNTMMLEEMNPHSAYVIQVDHLGNKEICCMGDFGMQNNHNVRRNYLKGLFGGTPYVDGIDYDEIAQEIDDGEGDA